MQKMGKWTCEGFVDNRIEFSVEKASDRKGLCRNVGISKWNKDVNSRFHKLTLKSVFWLCDPLGHT